MLARQARAGLPADLPRVITEYGYSAFTGAPEMGRAGALLDADVAARFLARDGGAAAYLYGYEPDVLSTDATEPCHSWGALTTLLRRPGGRLRPTGLYWAARLLDGVWAAGPGPLHPASVRVASPAGVPAVRAYGLRDASGAVRVLVENLDPTRAIAVRLDVAGAPPPAVAASVFDAATYVWHPAGPRGYAAPDTGLRTATAAAGGTITIGPYGMAALRAG